jgi:hypothetical protein
MGEVMDLPGIALKKKSRRRKNHAAPHEKSPLRFAFQLVLSPTMKNSLAADLPAEVASPARRRQCVSAGCQSTQRMQIRRRAVQGQSGLNTTKTRLRSTCLCQNPYALLRRVPLFWTNVHFSLTKRATLKKRAVYLRLCGACPA